MSALTHYDKARPVSDFMEPFAFMRREIDRLFDQANSNGWAATPDRNLAGLRMDIGETEKDITISAELPGVEIKDVDVSLVGGVLTIKGEKRSARDEKRSDYHLVERSFGSFERRIGVPDGCDPAQVRAEFTNGVLTVTIPKPASAAPAAKIKITKS